MSTASMRRLRVFFAAWLVLTLGAGLPVTAAGTATPQPQLFVEELLIAPAGAPAARPRSADAARSTTAASPQPCSDGAYSLEGGRWTQRYGWSFRARTTPSGMTRSAAAAAIKRGFANIARANNDCGRPDRVNARQRYLGVTGRKPSCVTSDGYNVVGFRRLSTGTAARACWWVVGNRIVEADVQINSALAWTTTLAGCRGQTMLEAVVTHEAGHVFGVGHVGERRHGRLTMSTYIDGDCQNSESTLGLGDLLALERLYP